VNLLLHPFSSGPCHPRSFLTIAMNLMWWRSTTRSDAPLTVIETRPEHVSVVRWSANELRDHLFTRPDDDFAARKEKQATTAPLGPTPFGIEPNMIIWTCNTRKASGGSCLLWATSTRVGLGYPPCFYANHSKSVDIASGHHRLIKRDLQPLPALPTLETLRA
jgi:hypothetical protein